MRVGIEIGGTFTDLVAVTDQGIRSIKVSSTPSHPERGVFDAIKRLGDSLDAANTLVHGSTVATNALLERRGARTLLVTTAGFRDILELQREHKSRNYDLRYARTRPLVPREWVVEAHERLDAHGVVVEALDEDRLRADLARLIEEVAPEALAVCLLHSYQNPVHEKRVRDIATELAPALNISLSSEIMPEYREYERASTTVMNAYLAPVVDSYLGALQTRLDERAFAGRFFLMQSNGGMLPAERSRQHAVRTLVSGPAAGVTGAIAAARASGFKDIITLDMGGTSTDICLVNDATAQIVTGKLIDRLPVLAPMLDITAIGAGGGSLAWFDNSGMFQIGPRSAGAQPGPACYGRGGNEATLTDACVLMGLIRPHRFLGGSMPLDVAAARRAMLPVAERLGFDINHAAEGIFRLACANMLQATRQVSIERGYDPRDYVMVAYGGAGPLHAAVLADELGARAVLVPPNPGVTSAMGLVLADFRLDYVRSRMLRVAAENNAQFSALFEELRAAAQHDLTTMSPQGTARFEYSIDLRYVGQGYELSIDVAPFAAQDGVGTQAFLDDVAQRFHAMHDQRLGHSFPGQAIRAINYRARLVVPQPPLEAARMANPPDAPSQDAEGSGRESGKVFWGGKEIPCEYVARTSLRVGERVAGAALVEDDSASTFVPPGWSARVDEAWALIIERDAQ